MIELKSISKNFGEITAVDAVSICADAGELFGLIGPDGAGKTTIFRILTTLLLPDAGEAFVDGKNVQEEYKNIRNIIGYMPGTFSLYQDLSVEENLSFFAAIFGTTIDANYDLIKDIYQQIEPFKKRKAGALSGGMKQKLALSCALIHKPKVLFLDEPTTGVDAVSRKEFWQMLKRLQKHGITIIVSTPYMDEASLCDRVALIQEAKIMDVDTPEGIINKFERTLFEVRADNKYLLIQTLRAMDEVHSAFPFGDSVHVTCNDNHQELKLKTLIESSGLKNVTVQITEPNIEDCFMALMTGQ